MTAAPARTIHLAVLGALVAGVLLAMGPAGARPTRPAVPTPSGAVGATPSGPSPTRPNPHPPLGGIGPGGQSVGGTELRSRAVVRPRGSHPLPAGITARSWMVTDLDTGAILAARDAHGRYQPASVLKLLTAITLLPRLPGRRVITASADAANAEGSAVGLVPGGRYTVDTLFRSMLLMSGNDAAQALAEAGGGVRRTVAAMNARAAALGAYDTVVQTPSGLDGWRQLTSAYDLTLVLRAAADNPRFVDYDRAATARLPKQKVGHRHWRSVPLYNQSQDFFDRVPGALVAKIGFTDAAQHTYACVARRQGRRIGVVLLRAQRQPLDQWQQAARLLRWAYAQPASTAPVGRLVGPLPAPASVPPTAPAGSTAPTASPPTSAAADVAARSAGSTSVRTEAGAGLAAAAAATGLAVLGRRRRRNRF